MVSAGSWRDHFKIDDKILQAFWDEFSESSPLRASELSLSTADQSLEFILWCVREGHFSEEAFSHFQSNLAELPKVRADFFNAPVDHEFWNRVKDLHPWTADCLPLTEWDGVLLIGSVWPRGTFKPSLQHRLVLATPTELREFYQRFQTKDENASAHVTVHESEPVFEMPLAETTPVSGVSLASSNDGGSDSENGDPFAALQREIGMTSDDDSGSHLSIGDDETPQDDAPEGLVIPDGLKFSKEELLRLNEEPNESGTLVHDFETGLGEVVKQDDEEEANIVFETPSPAMAIPVNDPSVLEHNPLEDSTPLQLSTDSNGETELDLDKTQPSAVIKAPAPKAPSKPTAAPVIPFAPMVTPERPAMVKPPPPIAIPQSDVSPAAITFSTTPTKAPNSEAAPSEATVVVSSDEVLTLASKPARRPLFEPSATSAAETPAVAPVAPQPIAANNSNTQTGSETTGSRRRLESTPVTSFFSGNTNPGFQRPTAPKTGSHYAAQMGRVVTVSKINPRHLDQCATVDEAGAQALLQVCNNYETAMILLFKDGTLQPWKWNDLFLSVKGDKPDNIDLKDPSIFKVVFRTAKPYHGYVVTSPVNQKFFNEFYRGMLPKHASVIPIMIDGRMGGMLLGFTNSKIDYRQSLRLMERLSFDLGRVFKSIRANSAKAS